MTKIDSIFKQNRPDFYRQNINRLDFYSTQKSARFITQKSARFITQKSTRFYNTKIDLIFITQKST